ncbi:hypothetical protein L3Q82_006105 [Scortum barcoo]|uniref:Uncharacterized protein n=1 Tax=Scortum barcoo TaxID=214431 RepID=A0ACB8X5N8_9TELE|nr:hypothetical protein L3Q82_006105 [Scortum barcoo]
MSLSPAASQHGQAEATDQRDWKMETGPHSHNSGDLNTRFPLPRPAWLPQPDHKPPVSTLAPPSVATGFPEKNSV